MISNVIDNIRRDKATFARDAEYIKETAYDDVIDERLEVAESQYVRESVEELQEAADILNHLSSNIDPIDDYREITNIMESDGNITFEQMITETASESKNSSLVDDYTIKIDTIKAGNDSLKKLLKKIKQKLVGKNNNVDATRTAFEKAKKLISKQKKQIDKVQKDLAKDIQKCDCPITKKKLNKLSDELQKCSDEIGKLTADDYV